MLRVKDILPLEYKTNLSLMTCGLIIESKKLTQHFQRLVDFL